MVKKNQSDESTTPQPMDPTPTITLNESAPMTGGVCYALETLSAEVLEVFDVQFRYTDANGWGIALGADIDHDNEKNLGIMLESLIGSDERVAAVTGDSDPVHIMLRNDPTLYDSREPFGIVAAFKILHEDAEDMTAEQWLKGQSDD